MAVSPLPSIFSKPPAPSLASSFKRHTRFSGEAAPGPAEAQPIPERLPLPDAVNQKLRQIARRNSLAYRQQFQAVLDEAKAYLTVYAQTYPPAQAAVVLDLDETLLDNTAMELQQMLHPEKTFRDIYMDWHPRGESPAIPEMLAFVHWLQGKGFPIFFASFRKQDFLPGTIENLRKIGLPPGSYAGLYLNSDRSKSANQHKRDTQATIQALGFRIAAVVGDQTSDIEGALGQGFLLPSPESISWLA